MLDEPSLEFGPDDSVAAITASLYGRGVGLVRSLYARALIERVAAAVGALMEHLDAQLAQGKLDPDIAKRHAHNRAFPLSDVVIDGTPAVTLLASERVQAIASLCLRRSAIMAHPQISYVRSVRPEQPSLAVPYHQDSRILSCELVNLWIPLCDCGRDLPGLEVIARRSFALEPTMVRPDGGIFAQMGVEIEPAAVYAKYGTDHCWTPEFRAGDALIFLGTTVHRSHIVAGMHGERLSLDLRLI